VPATHYQKAITYGTELGAINALDPTTEAMVARAYYETKDFPNAQKYAQMSVDASKATGQAPSEVALDIVMSSQANQHNEAGAQQTLENLALNYNRSSDWSQLIDVALGGKNIKDADALYLLRLKMMIPDAMKDFDYLSLGSVADQQGYSTEAYSVYQKGIAAGKITAGKAGAGYGHARSGAAIDQKSLGQIAASAEKSKTGEQDIKLAEDYWGYGRFADAEVAARRAISKGGLKDPSEGPMLLGMLLVAQGKYDDAVTTLDQVHGSPSRNNTAHLWSVYAQAQKKGQGATAQAPASH
jgi:tetratricopeptide (TPR) repeat protein